MDLFIALTPYGETLKKDWQPFPVGSDEELALELAELEGIIRFIRTLTKGKIQQLKDLLQQLPYIRAELDYLKVRATLNSPMLFNLAKFLFLAREVNILLATTGWWDNCRISWQVREDLYQVLKITGNYSFYLGNFGDQSYQQLTWEISRLEQELTKLAGSQEEQILRELGVASRYFSGGLLVVSRADNLTAARLMEDERLVIIKENFATVTFKRVATGPELAIKEKLDQAKSKLAEQERELLESLSVKLAGFQDCLQELAVKLGRLDWLLARGFFAVNYGGTIPALVKGKNRLVINKGIHPIVQNKLRQRGADFVPVSIDLTVGVAVLTGANMGGKTITLKTVGTLQAMAQMALPVTVDKMEFTIADFIFYYTTGEKEPVGLSSFGAELQAINDILTMREKKGLVLFDEPARGTNPEEGPALAHAFLQVFQQGNCLVLVTTHFDRLVKEESFVHWQVKGLKNLTNLHNLADIYQSFDYGLEKIISREKVPRDALKVARLMKVDEQVLQLAEKYLNRSQKSGVQNKGRVYRLKVF